jgi:hypothetical protein
MNPSHLIVILGAFLVCSGWLAAIVTSPRQGQAPGEVYAWPVLLAAAFFLLSAFGIRYLAPEIARFLGA